MPESIFRAKYGTYLPPLVCFLVCLGFPPMPAPNALKTVNLSLNKIQARFVHFGYCANCFIRSKNSGVDLKGVFGLMNLIL